MSNAEKATHAQNVIMNTKGSTDEEIANETWRKGFIHLTVDGNGLVSLWDHEIVNKDTRKPIDSYLKLPLTEEQQKMIEETMKKDGYTP